QYCGKDNLRQQSAIWQGMLLAAGLPNTSNIIIDGFIISGGQKMSKSIGNVINPFDILEMFKDLTDYPEDVLRFILLHEVPSFEDGDLTVEAIKIAYTAYLANGIGNLTSRIMKMATVNQVRGKSLEGRVIREIKNFDINTSLKEIMHEVSLIDEYIATNEPFKVVKIDAEKGKEMIEHCLKSLETVAEDLAIYLPRTSLKILECIRSNAMPEKPLFNRLP
ncbi:MAG: class I tRNA ligase family protein, partial [Candidatus Kapabacteria bacterium]|nr:class I tRNA ligase family protein [Candidatus Kapabacteria bacterium]